MRTRNKAGGKAAGLVFAAMSLASFYPTAADVVIHPERAAIQVAADPATYVRAGWFTAAEELRLHLKLIAGCDVGVVSNGAANAAFVFHVGEAPPDDPGPFDSEEARWRVDGTGAWFYGDKHPGPGFAVTDFLESALGVRWPWHTNVSYRAQNPIRLAKTEGRWKPGVEGHRFRRLRWDPAPVWNQRMRCGSHNTPSYGHGFIGYGKRFAETHPEWFAMRADGLRLPPGVSAEAATNTASYVERMDRMSMCLTAPGLAEQKVEDWRKKGARDWINVCDNDVYGSQMCQCANCKALDMPHPDDEPAWLISHLSDRSVNFAKRVVALARKINPRVRGCIYAYNGTEHAPQREKIENDELAVMIVPTRVSMPQIRRLYSQWKAAGFNTFGVRPNRHAYYRISCLPVGSEKHFFDVWQYEHSVGARWFDYDAAMRVYAPEYFRDYVIYKAMQDPSKDFAYWENDYMEAFGAAKEDVREWYRYWREEVWEKRIVDNLPKFEAKGFYFIRPIFDNLGSYYRAEDFATTAATLQRALARPGLTAQDRARVEELVEFTEGARLLFHAVVDKTEAATKALYEFRKAHGMPTVMWEENYIHDITGVKAYLYKHAPEDIPEYIRKKDERIKGAKKK